MRMRLNGRRLGLRTATAICAALCLFHSGGSSAGARRKIQDSASPNPALEAMRLSFYAYDHDLPLRAAVKPLDQDSGRIRYAVQFDSIHDQRVTAILAIPRTSSAPYPAAVLVHGSGGNKDTSYINWSSATLAASGIATLAIDTQYHGDRARPERSGEIHMPDSYTMRDAWIQSVVDIRRAVDYLQSRRDIAPGRIGYLGFSQGGMLGAVAGGVEPRLACLCLAVPGGGLLDIVRHIDEYPFIKAHWPVTVTPDLLRKAEEITAVTDPIYFVGRIQPRPLLIIVATHDEVIPPSASDALIRAAHATPEQIKRWPSGHVLHPNALFDIRDFFRAHLVTKPTLQ